jgi:hypothetical protein
MQTTEKKLKEKNEMLAQSEDGQIRSLESGSTSEAETQRESTQLSRNLAKSLMKLIDDVNKSEVTPESVNASCNAAAQIYKILRLNFEMKKEGF